MGGEREGGMIRDLDLVALGSRREGDAVADACTLMSSHRRRVSSREHRQNVHNSVENPPS